MYEPYKQKTLCFDSQWGSGWHINDYRWRQRCLPFWTFSRDVIAAMLVDENKQSLISFFFSSIYKSYISPFLLVSLEAVLYLSFAGK